MEDADPLKCSEVDEVDNYVSIGLPWILAISIIIFCWIKDIFRQVNVFNQTWFVGNKMDHNLKYDLLLTKLDNLHLKLDKLQKTYEGQFEELGQLKKRSSELQSAVDFIKSRLMTSQFTNGPGPPPPPPPPPPFSLVTPVVKAAPISSAKTEKSKKAPTGPPQFSISQADISKMLQRLKKTSSNSRLLGSGNTAPRKTPPRRKLFGKTPGHSRRRSISALSPGEIFRHKTPLSSISPPTRVETDINKNGCDLLK